ncbi:RNA recognition motif domain-containing protein [Vibrio navarrensis]|uniref:RNA recognition motif domain-containing protein n=1 Tax=Vibrio navarrensis TaxID=29495 RepID=UPI00186A0E62|nr:RNA-binding protein [Vibrio navarrensis]MBE4607598.1 RNA-binding protein [Vibrio navarrensis]MBE4612490.1 RNA-binding protein [Vibrio navarrensis]
MTYKKAILSAVLAIVGGLILTQVDVSPAISFVLGVVCTFFIFTFLNDTPTPTPTPSNDDPAIATKTLYVGNLPYKSNETDIRQLFAQHGEVYAVRLMKDKRTGKRRGFGFVVMASTDAQQAVDALNEKEYIQRTLKVRIANDPKSQEADTPLSD